MQCGIIPNSVEIAFKVVVVDRVETDECCEQSPIGLGDLVAAQILPVFKDLFEPFKGVKQRCDSLVVSFLRGRKAAAVDAIVNGLVDPRIDGVYVVA